MQEKTFIAPKDPTWVSAILYFWFRECSPSDWFTVSDKFDEKIKYKFGKLLLRCAQKIPSSAYKMPRPALASIILLDQFPRNIYRGTPNSYRFDPLAFNLAVNAVNMGFDLLVKNHERSFIYMPFMHQEDLETQKHSLKLFTKLGNESEIKFAQAHYDAIKIFGRFPQRNKALGRESTSEEEAYLNDANRIW